MKCAKFYQQQTDTASLTSLLAFFIPHNAEDIPSARV